MKIVVFTTDVTPLAGLPTSGTALRTYGLIQGLKAHGHEVITSVPKSALGNLLRSVDRVSLDSKTQAEIDLLERCAFDGSNQGALISEFSPDAILCGHWPAMTLQTKPSQAVIIDLAGPHLLERHYQGSANQLGAIMAKVGVVGAADYYIVSGPRQRLYFLSFLLRAQVPNAEKRIVTIPMPLDPHVPSRTQFSGDPNDFPRFVFGGVFLPWQDPSAALEQVAASVLQRNKGSLTLIGGAHPNYPIKEGVYAKLFQELGKNPRVVTKPLLPYAQFLDELSQADVAVDLMKWNLERELAMTIRSTTYLWAGVPVIYNDYADLGELIRRYDAGWCVSPSDRTQLAEVVERIVSDPALVMQKSANASRLARELFAWDRAVEPLLPFLSVSDRGKLRETDIIVDFPDSASFPLVDGTPVEQYFVCRIDGLSRVECRIATHGRSVASPVTFSLYEVPDGQPAAASAQNKRFLIAQKMAAPDSIVNNEWFALDVEPLRDSGGKTFLLRIESSSTTEASSASPWAVKGSPYPLIGFYYGSKPQEHAALCLRTTCQGAA